MKRTLLTISILAGILAQSQQFTNLEPPPKRTTQYVAPRKQKPKQKPVATNHAKFQAEKLLKEEEARLQKEEQAEDEGIAIMEKELREADRVFENDQNYSLAYSKYLDFFNNLDEIQIRNLDWLQTNYKGNQYLDFQKAKICYEKAIENGNPIAMNNLGYLYYNGQGVSQDFGMAKYWFEKAAEKGNADAMANLGSLYLSGEGVQQDFGMGRYWTGKAVEKGNADAMANLAYYYIKGEGGVTKDFYKAFLLLEKSANSGSYLPFNMLGILYEKGLGIEQNYTKAIYFYEKACKMGNVTACDNLKKLQ